MSDGYKAEEIYSAGSESDEEDKHKFVRYRKSKVEILSSRLVWIFAAYKSSKKQLLAILK